MMRVLYQAPNSAMKDFLVATLPLISGLERLESLDFAKLLTEKLQGRAPFNTNEIANSFSWLNKIGVLDYDRKYEPSGGWRLFIYRKCGEGSAVSLIEEHGDYAPVALAPKKSKECCDDPRIVKSKKSGKRKCKNCGTKVAAKKDEPKEDQPKAPAKKKPCCDSKHVVKSKKTGERRCKNCGKKYPTKKAP